MVLTLAHPWNIARTRGMTSAATVLVELTDADGVVGRGEAAPISRYGESVESVSDFLRRLDPDRLSFSDPAGGAEYVNSVLPGNLAAKCAVEVALLDGAAKRVEQPLYDFLGLGFCERTHVTSFTVAPGEPGIARQKLAEAAAFPILKIKVATPGDRTLFELARETAPSKRLRLDANEGWPTKELALRNIEEFAAAGGVELVEQPMPASVPSRDWAWLKERSPVPVFADESYHLATDATRAADCFHGVNVKLAKAGGIGPALAALRAARTNKLSTMLGCMIESSLLISAGAHLAELCDFLDLDGHLLIADDPFEGVTVERGVLSFARAREKFGAQASLRAPS